MMTIDLTIKSICPFLMFRYRSHPAKGKASTSLVTFRYNDDKKRPINKYPNRNQKQ